MQPWIRARARIRNTWCLEWSDYNKVIIGGFLYYESKFLYKFTHKPRERRKFKSKIVELSAAFAYEYVVKLHSVKREIQWTWNYPWGRRFFERESYSLHMLRHTVSDGATRMCCVLMCLRTTRHYWFYLNGLDHCMQRYHIASIVSLVLNQLAF